MITITHLSFTYPDGTKALKELSLTIHETCSIGIVGANGAGKSTLVNHLNGYYLPQQGSITINGIPINKKNLNAIRLKVGLLFQNPDDQLFMARLYDDVAFGLENLGMQKEEISKRVEQTLQELHLWHLRDKAPMYLSQGEKRFAAFATILVMQPEVIVMDEPTSDLDPRNRRALINIVKALHNITTITVSHDLDFIWDTCQRVCILNNGEVTAEGATQEILSNKALLEANHLELPLRLQR